MPKLKGKKKLTKKMQLKFVEQWLESDIPILEDELKKSLGGYSLVCAAEIKAQLNLMYFIRDELITGNTNQYPDGSYDV